MPSYKVKAKGFYRGTLYDPRGRSVLTVPKALKPVPSWLELSVSKPTPKKKASKAEAVKASTEELQKATAPLSENVETLG